MEEGVRKEPGGSQEVKARRKGDRASGGLVKSKEMSGSDGRRFCGTETSGVIFLGGSKVDLQCC